MVERVGSRGVDRGERGGARQPGDGQETEHQAAHQAHDLLQPVKRIQELILRKKTTRRQDDEESDSTAREKVEKER